VNTLQFFSIGLAHFLKQRLRSQNNMDKPPNYSAIVYNRIEFLIQFIKLQMPKYMSQCLSTSLQMITVFLRFGAFLTSLFTFTVNAVLKTISSNCKT